MKKCTYFICGLLGFALVTACSEDENNYGWSPGNPVVELKTPFTGAYFGDELPFTVSVSDNVPLSALTVDMYYGDERVAQKTIRVKENGDCSGTISVPYFKDTPDGAASVEFTLLDTHMTGTTKSYPLPVGLAPYPYLILVTADASYPMLPTETPHEYSVTGKFASNEVPAYIKTPVMDDHGNVLTFGSESGAIVSGVTSEIPFASTAPGTFAITFNIKTYEAGPFFEIRANGENMDIVDKDNYRIDLDLAQGQEITFDGITDIADWWIDPDFLARTPGSDNTFTLLPIDGRYRIMANLSLGYFRVEVMSGDAPATLQEDGNGAVWVIGNKVGKPSITNNETGWNPGKALCMAPIGDKKYRLTVVGGEQIKTDEIDFKFFHQKDWGGEFKSDALSTASDIVFVGDGSNGADDGNLAINPGVTLETGALYEFVLDVSAGRDNAILSVTKK